MTEETAVPQAVVAVTENVASRYFEITVDGEFAGGIVYEVTGSTMTLTHTQIEAAFRGRGLVTILIRETLDEIRRRGLRIVSRCPIVDVFVAKRPEYAGVVETPLHTAE
jgi:predicted GNAT family acetyltransferase